MTISNAVSKPHAGESRRTSLRKPIRITSGSGLAARTVVRAGVPVELLSRDRPIATALVDDSAKELALQSGDEVDIIEVRHGWALVRNTQGEVGWTPESHIDTSSLSRF
jgi:SH3 domain